MKFLTYKGTMQETSLRLMGRKMLVGLMMEGKFSGEGLQSLDADEDLMSAMARELVERAGVGQSADAVWADLKRQRALHMPSNPPEIEAIEAPEPLCSIQQEFPALVLMDAGKGKSKQTPVKQLSLFR